MLYEYILKKKKKLYQNVDFRLHELASRNENRTYKIYVISFSVSLEITT